MPCPHQQVVRITVALVDDYDVVLLGVAQMLDPYRDRVVIAELDANEPVQDNVDIVLYDSFAQPESDHDEISVLIDNPRARRVVIYTWNFHPHLIRSARQQGVHGYLSKTLPARDLVAALEAVHAGEIVVSDPPPRPRSTSGLNWPGRGEGLTDRESEILALITQGKSNAEVATLAYLSPNTVKSYIRTIYRKIDVGQPHPGGAVGRQERLHARPPPDRPLARRPLTILPLPATEILPDRTHCDRPVNRSAMTRAGQRMCDIYRHGMPGLTTVGRHRRAQTARRARDQRIQWVWSWAGWIRASRAARPFPDSPEVVRWRSRRQGSTTSGWRPQPPRPAICEP